MSEYSRDLYTLISGQTIDTCTFTTEIHSTVQDRLWFGWRAARRKSFMAGVSGHSARVPRAPWVFLLGESILWAFAKSLLRRMYENPCL